jgi:hypothetical protein
MRNYLIKSVLALACFTLVSVPMPVQAQESSVTVTLSAGPSTVSPGGTVAAFGRVFNNSTSRVRLKDTFTSLAACGSQTMMGYGRLTLAPGESILVTVSYPIPPDACPGMYTITFAVGSGKNSAESSATAYITVQ